MTILLPWSRRDGGSRLGWGEEGGRPVSCGLRALPGGSAGTGPIHASPQPQSRTHSSATQQEQHQDMPSTPTLLTLPQGSLRRSQAAPAFNLGPQASPQYPGRPETPKSMQDAAGAAVEVIHLLCQLTQAMEQKVASGIRHWPRPGWPWTLLLSPKVPWPTLALPSSKSRGGKAKAGQREPRQ